jgi:OOP family OmpA-OmpF porin
MEIKLIVAASVLALGAAAALAEEDSGVYVLGSVGQSKFQTVSMGGLSTSGWRVDDTDTAYKLQIGYQFNKNFALETGYVDFGKVKAASPVSIIGGVASSANGSIEAHAWNLSLIGGVPLGETISVFGKLGAIYSNAKGEGYLNDGVTRITVKQTANKSGVVYGLGVNFNFNKQFGARAEYEIYDKVGGGYIDQTKIDVWSVGLFYKF